MLRNKTWCKLYTQMYFILVFEPLFIQNGSDRELHASKTSEKLDCGHKSLEIHRQKEMP